MGLSEAMLFAFAATIICAFAIAEKIIDIDFAMYYFHLEKQIRVIFQREWILHFAERWFIRWNCWESVSFAEISR